MVSAPAQKPLINIPGISTAKKVEMQTQGRGESLVFRMYVGNKTLKEVRLDPDNECMDRSWFGLVIRELDRTDWRYVAHEKDGITQFAWTKH